MPHEVETMAFAGQVPWHGLGTPLAEEDLYDWQKASDKAGLAWDVELVPIVTADTNAQVAHRGVRRTTDGHVLGVVGPRYCVLQNRDAFKWFQPFLDAREAALDSLWFGDSASLNRHSLQVALDMAVWRCGDGTGTENEAACRWPGRGSVLLFYREQNGDFLAIDAGTNDYYRRVLGRDDFEGRATAIEGLAGSVCTTGISRDYLRQNCKRVARAAVPAEWRRAIGL